MFQPNAFSDKVGPGTVAICITASCTGPHTGHQAGSGWITGRDCAMGVREGGTALGQAMDIGRTRLGIATRVGHPVVEIVHRDHEDVHGLVCRGRKRIEKSE